MIIYDGKHITVEGYMNDAGERHIRFTDKGTGFLYEDTNSYKDIDGLKAPADPMMEFFEDSVQDRIVAYREGKLDEKPEKEEKTTKTTKTAKPAVSADDAAQIVQSFMSLLSRPQVDMKALKNDIKKCVDEYINKNYTLPQRIEIKTLTGETKDLSGIFHKDFKAALVYAENRVPIYLYGPAGCGKSHMAAQLAEAMSLPYYPENCLMDEFSVKGFVGATNIFQETLFYKAFKNGGVYLIDEADASNPRALITINQALANGLLTFSNGEVVHAHKDFYCIAAGNTNGLGATESYSARSAMDASTLDRFIPMYMTYDKQVELALTGNDKELVDFAHAFRDACKRIKYNFILSYRALQRVAAFKNVVDHETLMKQVILRYMSANDAQNISYNLKLEGDPNEWALLLAKYKEED